MADEKTAQRVIVAMSQVYPPDPASLGQHLADATTELARRGHRTVVYTANRGYNDPTACYKARETINGVDVRRIPFSSFGKGSIFSRLLGGVSFLGQAIWRALFLGRVDTVLVSTSPPIAGIAGVVLATLKRARLVYWVMDLNPDQAVAQGVAAPESAAVRAYECMNRVVLGRADAVVAMDRFMATRLNAKRDVGERMHVIAPWPHENDAPHPTNAGNRFRVAHCLEDKFVVMYSGNHSAANPLRTVLGAALVLQDDPRFAFAFVGGGSGKTEVEAAGAKNVLSLPYQPLETLPDSLAAADVHVVTMGDDMVGIVHPCKVYGALAVSRPILFVGPPDCHVTDLLSRAPVGWHISHGDVTSAVATLRRAAAMQHEDRVAMGERAHALIVDSLSKADLCAQFCDIVDSASPLFLQDAVPHAGYAHDHKQFENS